MSVRCGWCWITVTSTGRSGKRSYVKTHSGWVYVAFIIDVFSRMIVGWQASRSLRSDLVIDALEMAVFNRRLRRRRPDPAHPSQRPWRAIPQCALQPTAG